MAKFDSAWPPCGDDWKVGWMIVLVLSHKVLAPSLFFSPQPPSPGLQPNDISAFVNVLVIS